MKRARFLVGDFRNALCVRSLTYALLLLFAYGSTAEALHNHGNILAGASETDAISVSESREGTTSSNDRPQAGDCVLCQFQQSLSSAAMFSPSLLLVSQEFHTTATVAVAPLIAVATSTQQGRAP